ncbi:hypothetical protein E4U42_005968 [Claviceps africana]|uniref:Uncharacterized protein n=1 Tax=Claviceps africana TaxID=83212 RepID=A0A8K0NH27_9HYPO|nr:hypothetical protein E4U42_005968 [Claviceps africana]
MMARGFGETAVDETGEMGIIAIGMTVGNPVVDQEILSVQPQVITTVSAPKDHDVEEQPPSHGLVRSKSKRWALFGRSKSTRVKYSDRSLTQPSLPLNATVTRTISNSVISREALSDDSQDAPFSSPRRSRERSLTEPAKRLERSLTAPGIPIAQRKAKLQRPEIPQRAAPAPPPENSLPSDPCSAQTLTRSPETFSREPLLDVEIPSITMERYSVMFAGLLERRGAASLARRQTRHEKFPALREDDAENDPPQQENLASRRKKSVDRGVAHQRPLRLDTVQGSPHSSPNASPAVPRTSNNVLADVVDKHNEHVPAPHIVRLASVRGRNMKAPPLEIPKGEDGRPQLRSKFHIESPKQGSTPIWSRFDSDESADQPARQQEPCSTKTSTGRNESSSAQHHRSIATNYTHTVGAQSCSSLSQDGLSEDDTDEMEAEVIQDAVQVSIARQISVSKDQSRVLGPLRMNPVNGQGSVEIKSPVTPRLIESKKGAFSPVATTQKSKRVVLRRMGGV